MHMYMYVYVRVCTRIYMYIHVCTCMYMYVHVCTCMYMYVHVCTCVYMYVHVCTCMYMYVHVCTCMYMYVHVCTCMYMYVHVCTYVWFHVGSPHVKSQKWVLVAVGTNRAASPIASQLFASSDSSKEPGACVRIQPSQASKKGEKDHIDIRIPTVYYSMVCYVIVLHIMVWYSIAVW